MDIWHWLLLIGAIIFTICFATTLVLFAFLGLQFAKFVQHLGRNR